MVLLEPQELGHNVLITSFINDISKFIDNDKLSKKLMELFHYISDMTVTFIYKRCKFPVPTGPNFVVDNMLKLFDTYVRQWQPKDDDECT